MINKQINVLTALSVVLFTIIALSHSTAAKADPVGDALAAATAKLAPSVVTINAVINMQINAEGQSQDRDLKAQMHGTIISPDGLVLTTNTYFSSSSLENAFGSPPDSTDFSIKIVPSEIKIVVGNELTEYNGTIAASDSTLGLVFIQIRDLNGRTLPYIDFDSAAAANITPNIGDIITSVSRLDKNNDYAPFAIEDRLSGLITKPRKGYIPEGLAGNPGMPVLTSTGDVIGVISTLQTPRSEQIRDELSSDHSDIILPVSSITPLIIEAKKRAADLPPFVPPKPKPATPAVPTTNGKPVTTPAPSTTDKSDPATITK